MWLALPARADLYRWIDPQSGSVKFSSQRPLDPGTQAEVIPFTQGNPVPAAPPAVAATEKPPESPVAAAPLESRLQQLMAQLNGVTSAEFARDGAGLQQKVEAYEAVRAELDRIDPAGAARRRAGSVGLLERLRALSAQLNPADPARK